MSTRPFTQHYDPFDTSVKTTIGQINTLGVLVLVVLNRLFPSKVATARLEFMFSVDAKTLNKALTNLEIFGFASRSGSSKAELWIATDLGRTTVHQIAASTAASVVTLPSVTQPAQPALLLTAETGQKPEIIDGEILSAPDRSSSDQSDLIDLDQIDREEEKYPEKFSADSSNETDRQAAVKNWCQQHQITGDKLAGVLAEPFCTVERLEGWRLEMQRRVADGSFKPRNPANKFAALNYAIACCLHRDEPPVSAATPAALPVSQGTPAALPAGYVHGLHDPVFDQVLLTVAQHYGPELFMVINPRLAASDERPNKFTVLVAADRPDLRALIGKLAAGYSRKSYQVKIVTTWPGVTSGDTQPEIKQRSAALKLTHESLAGGSVYWDTEDTDAIAHLAGAGCTTEQYSALYRREKAKPFWKDKALKARHLAGQYRESVANPAASVPADRSSISRYTTVRA